MSKLPSEWVTRIFQRLTGVYGAQFRSKYSHVENGIDIGIAMAAEAWANELGDFVNRPEAISYALDHLPKDHAPNAIEFLDACKRCPRKEENHVRLEYKPTAEDKARQKEMAHKATAAVRPKEFDGLLWAKRPKSQAALNAVFDAKKNHRRFPALASVFDQLVADGISTPDGMLLKRWDGCQWVGS